MTTTPFKALRIFSVQFICEGCDNQFVDEMITVHSSFCACCDAECQPDGIEQYELELSETDEDEGELV